MWGRVFFTKNIFRGGKATQTEPSMKELHRSHFEELAFWQIEVIVSYFLAPDGIWRQCYKEKIEHFTENGLLT